MVKFTEIVNSSIEWTATILFRPFKLKKWLILTFAAFLSGSIVSGCNLPIRSLDILQKIRNPAASQAVHASVYAPANQEKQCPLDFSGITKSFKDNKPALFILLLISGIILIIFLYLLFLWISCRFSFVFLENVSKNDASLKKPFRENKNLGSSLFLFELSVFGGILITISILVFVFISGNIFQVLKDNISHQQIGKTILVCLPFGFVFLFLMLLSGIVFLITRDFVIVIMRKDNIRITQAWKKVFSILQVHKLLLVKYILLKIGLGICSAIIYNLLTLLSLIGIVLPFIILMGLFFILHTILQETYQYLYFVIYLFILIPALSFFAYFMFCLNLPFAVFFRTLSLKFIGRLEPHYDLFKLDIKDNTRP